MFTSILGYIKAELSHIVQSYCTKMLLSPSVDTSTLLLVLLSFVSASVRNAESAKASSCGYESCHRIDPNKINVHMVPHSHDDVGWLKTIDQYYYGTNNSIQHAGVRYIISSVVQALQENPDRRFIQVETAFFWKWWQTQGERTRNIVKQLVDSGQLEIVGGGWSMNDEAAANYQPIIDQFTLGLRTVDGLLGPCGRPKIGWQIDPFGHTSEMAAIFARLGYDAVMFARLDYRDVARRKETNESEFVWRGSSQRGSENDLFTSLVYRFYDAPSTFCWDVVCGDEAIVDDETSPLFNVERRVEQFSRYLETQASYYKTGNILVTMGGDFTYQAAQMYYENIDRLINGFRRYKNHTFNLIYSTPSCYVHAVNEMATLKNLKFPLKSDSDFIPYASDKHTYWSGYYTSRPNSKRFERQCNNLLQALKHLTAFTMLDDNSAKSAEDLTKLKEIVGVMQHHDAITGTEKQHVADDYVRLMTEAAVTAERNVGDIVEDLLKKPSTSPPNITLRSCLLSNVSICQESTNSKRFVVAIYNPLSRRVSHYVRLPVDGLDYRVQDLSGNSIEHQLAHAPHVGDVRSRETSPYELVFRAENIPPFGLAYYRVKKLSSIGNKRKLNKNAARHLRPRPNKLYLGNSSLGVNIDPETGLIEEAFFDGNAYVVSQNFLYYSGANGTNAGAEKRASGAYIFRPASQFPVARPFTANNGALSFKVYSGPLFDEVRQNFGPSLGQIVRVYRDENHIEFDWMVGPLEYKDNLGVEVISRFSSLVQSDSIFYVDSNGRDLTRRVRGARDDFNYTNEEPVSGNYYPVTSRIVLKGRQNEQLAVLNDRAQGGTSLENGQVELMIHRRLMNDDDFGVKEVLNETEFGVGVRVRGKHCLVMGEGPSVAEKQHDVSQRLLLSPWIFVGKADNVTLSALNSSLNSRFAGIAKDLPPNVQILTLEYLASNELLLRLEHFYEANEHPHLSQPAVVNLREIFTLFNITSLEEMTLGANQKLSENRKLKWEIKDDPLSESEKIRMKKVDTDVLLIRLQPSEIRTFIIKVAARSHPL